MSALCCRAGDSPLVAASRVRSPWQLYAELGVGAVSAILAGARPHPDERSVVAITALWLAVATGVKQRFGGVRRRRCAACATAARSHASLSRRLAPVMALTTIAIVIAALQNKRGHAHTWATHRDGRGRCSS